MFKSLASLIALALVSFSLSAADVADNAACKKNCEKGSCTCACCKGEKKDCKDCKDCTCACCKGEKKDCKDCESKKECKDDCKKEGHACKMNGKEGHACKMGGKGGHSCKMHKEQKAAEYSAGLDSGNRSRKKLRFFKKSRVRED